MLDLVGRLGLRVPTAHARHQLDGLVSIDHVAVPAAWSVTAVERHPASVDGSRLSDHDAYVVEAGPASDPVSSP